MEALTSEQSDGSEYLGYARQYGRIDVDYATWYNDWAKDLAKKNSRNELMRLLGISDVSTKAAAKYHHAAIAATTSMSSQSQRRAQTRNSMVASAELSSALKSALEIHDLFPEHAFESMQVAPAVRASRIAPGTESARQMARTGPAVGRSGQPDEETT